MTDDERVLEANEAFYRCFAAGDVGTMDALWARHVPVLTTHPWRPAIVGRAAVMASWQAVLAQPPDIGCSNAQVTRAGDVAFVTCLEHAGGGTLSATNVFTLEGDRWRLCHHHAGPVAPVFSAEPDEGEPVH